MPARKSVKKSAERKRPATTRSISELSVPHSPAAAGERPSARQTTTFSRAFYLVVVGGAFEESAEFARARRVAQLAQGFGFDLADAFASDGE